MLLFISKKKEREENKMNSNMRLFKVIRVNRNEVQGNRRSLLRQSPTFQANEAYPRPLIDHEGFGSTQTQKLRTEEQSGELYQAVAKIDDSIKLILQKAKENKIKNQK